MIDIETLGSKPGSVILSIGAWRFNHEVLLDSFDVVVDPVDCEDAGLKLDARTVMWWFDQPEEARAAWMCRDSVRLEYALIELGEWIRAGGSDDLEVWAKGASFDGPLLEAAFRAVGVDVPWGYWQLKCFRTFKDAFGHWEDCVVRPDVAHDAVEDARSQAMWLLNIEHQLRCRGVMEDREVEALVG